MPFKIYSDSLWFILLQALLVLTTTIALLKTSGPWTERSPISRVTRGDKSRAFLLTVTGAIVTVFVSKIFDISNFPTEGRVMTFSIDVFLICYLCLVNGWSTNKLIGILVRFETKNYSPHNGGGR